MNYLARYLGGMLLAAMLLAVVDDCAAVAAETAQSDEDSRALAIELVKQLGDQQFAQRERATEQLVNLSLPAIPALEEGRKHPDREIRYRSERILAIVREVDFQRRLAAFATNHDSDENYVLPGWTRFRELFGDTGESRGLFVEIQKAESQTLAAINTGPKEVSEALTERTQQLLQAKQLFRQELSLGNVAALLFLATDEHVPVTAQANSALYSFFSETSFRSSIQTGAQRDFLRKMLGIWIQRADDSNAYQGLAMALQYELKEGLVTAERVLRNGPNQVHIRQFAVLTIAKFGDESYLPLLETLLADETPTSTQRINQTTYQTQLRDVALAALVRLTKQDYKDYGFDRLQEHELVVFNTGTLGFETDEQRSAALEKWKEYRARSAAKR